MSMWVKFLEGGGTAEGGVKAESVLKLTKGGDVIFSIRPIPRIKKN